MLAWVVSEVELQEDGKNELETHQRFHALSSKFGVKHEPPAAPGGFFFFPFSTPLIKRQGGGTMEARGGEMTQESGRMRFHSGKGLDWEYSRLQVQNSTAAMATAAFRELFTFIKKTPQKTM